MEKITYVTGNYGKYVSVKDRFNKYGLDIDYKNIDIDEVEINDIGIISKYKAVSAYMEIGSPVFVIDSGFYIRSYPDNPNYPGAFVKRSGVANNVDKLLLDMKDVDDRYCYFMDCLTYYDGSEFYKFFGKSEGILSTEVIGDDLKNAKSNLWKVFIPKNCDKTLALMSDDERLNRNDGRSDATLEFINWVIDNNLVKVLKK